MHRAIILVSIIAFALLPLHALAHHGKEYLITSTYKTPERGSFFGVWSSSYVKSEHEEGEMVLEPGLLYGLTNRWSLELHTHHGISSDNFRTESIGLETLLRLFGPGEIQHHANFHEKEHPLSLALLFEYEKGLGDEHDAAEGRVIVGREFRSFLVVANLIAGKILEEDEDFHYLYAIGIKKTLSSAFAVGLELDGGFQRGEGFSLTPGLYGAIAQGLDFRLGPTIGFGDRAEEYQLRATILFEL